VDVHVIGMPVAPAGVIPHNHISVLVVEDLRYCSPYRETAGGDEPTGYIAGESRVGVPEMHDARHTQKPCGSFQLAGAMPGEIGTEVSVGQTRAAIRRHDEDHTMTLRSGARHSACRKKRFVVGMGMNEHESPGPHPHIL